MRGKCRFWPFWAIFGLIWPQYQFPKISTSIFDLVLTGLSEIREKILIANDLFDKNANFGHFGPFLACFWPVITPVAVLKALNEYICPNSDLIECVWQELLK